MTITTVVIPTPFTWLGCKYPQIKADSLQLKHLVCFIWNPLWWCIEPKMLELCRCPNIYGPDCICTVGTFSLGECCFSVGGAQAWNTLTVTASGMQGSPAQVTVLAQHLKQWRKQMYSFTALSSVWQMAAWDRETVAAAGAKQLESDESAGRSAELEVLIRCEGCSSMRRASSLVDQWREVVVAEGEEIWGS